MVKWVRAQLLYSDMLSKVEPLHRELKRLATDRDVKMSENSELETAIEQLQQSISAYKEEYAQLVAQAQSIKTDSANVKEKVKRSIQLLSSLNSERDRWQRGHETFGQQMDTLIGDTIVTSAFLAYAGYYDQQLRQRLFEHWCIHLDQGDVRYRNDIARIEYLSSADERVHWFANGLPKDDLCVENAVMVKRFNRYPLVIDPSGQALEFLVRLNSAGKQANFQVTSFLDLSFR